MKNTVPKTTLSVAMRRRRGQGKRQGQGRDRPKVWFAKQYRLTLTLRDGVCALLQKDLNSDSCKVGKCLIEGVKNLVLSNDLVKVE